MTAGRRIALLASVVVVAVVGFVVLKPGDSSKKEKQKDKVSTSAQQTAPSASARAKPAAPPVVQVRVAGGKPVGGVTKIEASKGERVRFTVSSDVDDEIHVHGYDLMKDVPAGGKASFSFPARIDGVFEVELENRGEQIASLEVQP